MLIICDFEYFGVKYILLKLDLKVDSNCLFIFRKFIYFKVAKYNHKIYFMLIINYDFTTFGFNFIFYKVLTSLNHYFEFIQLITQSAILVMILIYSLTIEHDELFKRYLILLRFLIFKVLTYHSYYFEFIVFLILLFSTEPFE